MNWYECENIASRDSDTRAIKRFDIDSTVYSKRSSFAQSLLSRLFSKIVYAFKLAFTETYIFPLWKKNCISFISRFLSTFSRRIASFLVPLYIALYISSLGRYSFIGPRKNVIKPCVHKAASPMTRDRS